MLTILSTSIAFSQDAIRMPPGPSCITAEEPGYFIPESKYWKMKDLIEIGEMYKAKYYESQKIIMDNHDFEFGIVVGILSTVIMRYITQ